MGAAPYFDEEELAALGRPSVTNGAAPKRTPMRLTHDPLCSKQGAMDGFRCRECDLILRTRADTMRREREHARVRHAKRPETSNGEQLPLWRDF